MKKKLSKSKFNKNISTFIKWHFGIINFKNNNPDNNIPIKEKNRTLI